MEIPLLNKWKSHIIKGETLKALEKLDLNLYIAPIHNTLDSVGLDKKDKEEVVNRLVNKGREFFYKLAKEKE
jgi:hypothetical protein